MSAGGAGPVAREGTPASSAGGGGWEGHRSSGLPKGRSALLLLGIMLGILMGALDNLIVVTALPKIVTDLAGFNGVSFVVSGYLIATTVATPIFGKLSDHFSRRDFFLAGLGLFIAGSILSGLSQSLSQLIAFRAVQGFGAGAFFPIGLSIIAVEYTPETRARLTGLFSSIFGIATIVGPLVGSAIVDTTTWRWVFYVNIPIGLVAIAVVRSAIGPLRPSSPKPFDTVGALLLTAWVGAFMLALVENSDSGWAFTDPRILGLLALASVVFVGFVAYELRVAEPVLPLRFFARRVVAAGATISFFRGIVMFAATTFVSILVAFVLGGTTDTVRDMLYWFVGPMIVGSAVGGALLTRVSYRPLCAFGMGLMVVGAVLLAGFTSEMGLWRFWGGATVTVVGTPVTFGLIVGGLALDLIPLGFGIGLTFAATSIAIQYAVPPKDIGAASSLVQFLQSLGGAFGLAILTSFQAFDLARIHPVPSGVSCPVPPLSPIPSGCLPYYQTLNHFVGLSYGHTFQLLVAFALAALAGALLLTGRLPKDRRGPSGPPPGRPAAAG